MRESALKGRVEGMYVCMYACMFYLRRTVTVAKTSLKDTSVGGDDDDDGCVVTVDDDGDDDDEEKLLLFDEEELLALASNCALVMCSCSSVTSASCKPFERRFVTGSTLNSVFA